ncbi:MAG: hypothetical protein K2K81_03770 [Muribaculaceae bacterium]|nr:hypothetical protein [Muribaculaceae bacterium]
MSEIERKYERRLERFEANGKKYTLLSNVNGYTFIEYKSYKGLLSVNNIILPPVFDSIGFDPTLKMAFVEIDGLKAIVDLFTGERLTPYNYDKIEFYAQDHSIIIYKNGLKGLFDVIKRCVEVEPGYSMVNRTSATRFTWMYAPEEGYYMQDSLKGHNIFLGSDIQECFDETNGHIFILRNNKIRMLTDEGTEDMMGYRKLLAKLNGRLTLYNSVKGVGVVADIYGNVL